MLNSAQQLIRHCFSSIEQQDSQRFIHAPADIFMEHLLHMLIQFPEKISKQLVPSDLAKALNEVILDRFNAYCPSALGSFSTEYMISHLLYIIKMLKTANSIDDGTSISILTGNLRTLDSGVQKNFAALFLSFGHLIPDFKTLSRSAQETAILQAAKNQQWKAVTQAIIDTQNKFEFSLLKLVFNNLYIFPSNDSQVNDDLFDHFCDQFSNLFQDFDMSSKALKTAIARGNRHQVDTICSKSNNRMLKNTKIEMLLLAIEKNQIKIMDQLCRLPSDGRETSLIEDYHAHRNLGIFKNELKKLKAEEFDSRVKRFTDGIVPQYHMTKLASDLSKHTSTAEQREAFKLKKFS